MKLYPCDLLFVHRDAKTASLQDRQGEVDEAVSAACRTVAIPPAIAVIPVRMIEAWLLFDEQAIRTAAGNPNGSVDLGLPRPIEVEISQTLKIYFTLILDATELGTHRRGRFNVRHAIHRIPQYIDDFSSLRDLPAFAALEERIVEVIDEQRWCE